MSFVQIRGVHCRVVSSPGRVNSAFLTDDAAGRHEVRRQPLCRGRRSPTMKDGHSPGTDLKRNRTWTGRDYSPEASCWPRQATSGGASGGRSPAAPKPDVAAVATVVRRTNRRSHPQGLSRWTISGETSAERSGLSVTAEIAVLRGLSPRRTLNPERILNARSGGRRHASRGTSRRRETPRRSAGSRWRSESPERPAFRRAGR